MCSAYYNELQKKPMKEVPAQREGGGTLDREGEVVREGEREGGGEGGWGGRGGLALL